MIMIGLVCNLIAMKFYPLTKEKMEEIQDCLLYTSDDLTDHDERAVLAELAVGLIDHEADERVSDTVPDTHHHGPVSYTHL